VDSPVTITKPAAEFSNMVLASADDRARYGMTVASCIGLRGRLVSS
jgi:hypothetical protein